jgi:hypothetical protein
MRFLRPLWVIALTASAVAAQPLATADVVVIVDTSTSMSRPGMDRERTSLLVAKLLADIVPGQLAVVRVLDVNKDKQWIPSHEVGGKSTPCSEDPRRNCTKVEPDGDWDKNVRDNKYGALMRQSRGDSAFKQQLDGHLAQSINNSFFGLAFRAAQGVFNSHPSGPPRTVIWLSDGETDDPARVRTAIRELRDQGAKVEAIVFGKGTTEFAKTLDVNLQVSQSPAGLMKAFASAFRRIVQAPYQVDNLIQTTPSFEMQPNVREAWIVTYGDATLGDVTIDTPAGPQQANYAMEKHESAGAYRVFYAANPAAGRWTVRANGGGADAAYAVVQRSALGPIYLEPRTAMAGVPVTIKASVGPQGTMQVLPGRDLPPGLELDITIEGKTFPLNDEGRQGDQTAGDGIYSAVVTFEKQQRTPVTIRVRSEVITGTINQIVEVTGIFRYQGDGPLTLDLGSFRYGGEGCSEVALIPAVHTGAIPFELVTLKDPGEDFAFEGRTLGGTMRSKGGPVSLGPNEKVRVCLKASTRAPSSEAKGEPWIELRVAGSSQADARVPIQLRWKVQGLPWMLRYKWPLISALASLVVLILAIGYLSPKNFPSYLSLAIAATPDDLESAPFVSIRQYRVGKGFFSDACACIHRDLRVNARKAGAVAYLHPRSGGTEVQAGSGVDLFRDETGDWEPVPSQGRRAKNDEAYRAGRNGPYFRIATKG